MHKNRNLSTQLFLVLTFIFVVPVFAYVGPGAGFAFAGSFLFIFAAFFLAFFNFMTFPIRAFIKFLKRRKTLKHAKYKRTVIIGFDGMDYNLLNRFMKEGKRFPNFEKLAKDGTFAPLFSTEPPVSPVAWSTFSTGVNPGKHNIFDFLSTDRNTYMPKMSGSEIIPPKKVLNIGNYTIPISKPKVELKRKSQSFWKIVGSKGIFSTVLRMPYSFPPEKFYGLMLSGLGTPDLRGSQGSFSFYSEVKGEALDVSEGVLEKLEKISDNCYEGILFGPENPFLKSHPKLQLKFKLTLDKENKKAFVEIGKEKIQLEPGKLSPWVKVDFKAGLVKVSGLTQLVLEEMDPIKLYFSPININPDSPSMPISHPKILAVYLSKLLGPYATLGMAEDTTALNEGVLSEEVMLEQIYTYQKEREKMFFDTFKKYKRGLMLQVFEATDRIQHMFWRYFKDANSPAAHTSTNERVINAIYEVYKEMDNFLGRLMPQLSKDDLLMIVSDHGFAAVNREFHLNSWLHKEGYLVLKDGKTKSGKWYADVDWDKSRAYGQGLNGLFLNMKNREKFGIVEKGEAAEKLKDEIKAKLLKVVDDKNGVNALKAVYKREEIYKGPYTQNAPDVVLGYNKGYKLAWESAVNFVGGDIFSDNDKMWSGDHCFTRDQVPGIFFSNKKIKEKSPRLLDISPTVLSAFGIKPPAFIEGKDLGV
ncbi:MAG: nucleotide pyrophosphatase [bacterium]|nr:nucleotide pyrophosphatase [bacterium]